jgi:hypothetical protein
MRRVVGTAGLCVVALLVLGLSACDVGPAVLQGTLTHTDTGEPLADVPVRVYSSTDESVVARGRTGDDGTYRFTSAALPDGTYRAPRRWPAWWAATPPPRPSSLPARSNAWMSGTSRSAGPDPSTTVGVDAPRRIAPWTCRRIRGPVRRRST